MNNISVSESVLSQKKPELLLQLMFKKLLCTVANSRLPCQGLYCTHLLSKELFLQSVNKVSSVS